MKWNLNKARSAAFATAILAYLSPQAASSDTITVPVFEQISPIPTIYNFGIGNDFTVIEFSAPGDVAASVRAIPNLGCAATDFAGFSVGSIALITRGTCQPDTNNLHHQQERQESPDKATAKLRE